MATLLSFSRPPRKGWSNDENAQFARIQRLLTEAGVLVEIEEGITDEGDPWCVFCSDATGEVIIHVAVIDGCYFFDSAVLPEAIQGRNLYDCAQRFMDDASLPAYSRSPKIMMHPSAMLTGVILTIFLYLEMITEPSFAASIKAKEVEGIADEDSENNIENTETSDELSSFRIALKQALQSIADVIQRSDFDRSGGLGVHATSSWASMMPNTAIMIAIAFTKEAVYLDRDDEHVDVLIEEQEQEQEINLSLIHI